MADATVTLRLNPGEFKLIQTALEIARLESMNIVNHKELPANQRAQSRSEAALFAELLVKLT